MVPCPRFCFSGSFITFFVLLLVFGEFISSTESAESCFKNDFNELR